MARMVDALTETRRPRDAKPQSVEAAAAPETGLNSPSSEDETDVPFIEVGAPIPKQGNLKPQRDQAPIPTILPLTRSGAEREATSTRKSDLEPFPIFQI